MHSGGGGGEGGGRESTQTQMPFCRFISLTLTEVRLIEFSSGLTVLLLLLKAYAELREHSRPGLSVLFVCCSETDRPTGTAAPISTIDFYTSIINWPSRRFLFQREKLHQTPGRAFIMSASGRWAYIITGAHFSNLAFSRLAHHSAEPLPRIKQSSLPNNALAGLHF